HIPSDIVSDCLSDCAMSAAPASEAAPAAASALPFLSNEGSVGDDEFYDAVEFNSTSSNLPSALRSSSAPSKSQDGDAGKVEAPDGAEEGESAGTLPPDDAGTQLISSSSKLPTTSVTADTQAAVPPNCARPTPEDTSAGPESRLVVMDLSSAESTPVTSSGHAGAGRSYFPVTPPGGSGLGSPAAGVLGKGSPPPLPPRTVSGARGVANGVEGEKSGSTSPPSSWPPGGEGEAEGKFKVVNKDTGEVFDLRELEKHLPADKYALLPSREILLERRRSAESEESARGGGGRWKGLKRGASQGRSKKNGSSDASTPTGAASPTSGTETGERQTSAAPRRKAKGTSIGRMVRDGLGKVALVA
ncbi:unnamed protein product, partial [Discosporangium mesarthrocarpum]